MRLHLPLLCLLITNFHSFIHSIINLSFFLSFPLSSFSFFLFFILAQVFALRIGHCSAEDLQAGARLPGLLCDASAAAAAADFPAGEEVAVLRKKGC